MKKNRNIQKIVIYGDSDFAEQVKYQLDSDDRYKVVAFTVDESKYMKNCFLNLPVIKFQLLENYFSKDEIKIFVAIGYTKMNTIREKVLKKIENEGYILLTYISKKSFLSRNVYIGTGSYIAEFVSIGSNAQIGKGVIILSNSSIAHNVLIEDFVFCSHSITIGGHALIKNNSFIGLNSTIKNSIIVSENNIIGCGSNVINSTDPESIYVGNPAKKIKDVNIDSIRI
jgi:sugar O-acyltransferase (sialic acid O-acetyltransferase NeuD family)